MSPYAASAAHEGGTSGDVRADSKEDRMKIVQFASFGVPHEVARCVEVADPGEPADDEVVVEVEAFPINPVDLLTISGQYAVKPDLPATPGSEGVGRVKAAGGGVGHVAAGDRVLLIGRGNWAQQLTVKGETVFKLPDDADVLQLAMVKINPATALLMLSDYVDLKAGDWVIQDAANSGVGNNLIRLAQADGIRTVNVVRRQSLIEPLRAIGGDVVVVDGDDLAARVAAAIGGAGIRLGIDAIAGTACMRLAECLAEGGTIVNYGMLSGEPCMVSPDQVVFRKITLTGFWLGGTLPHMSKVRFAELYGDLVGRIVDGSLRVAVEATYGIEDIQAALEHAGRQGRDGKILVTPKGTV